MLQVSQISFALSAILAVTLSGTADAAEKRKCDTFLAIFPTGGQEDVSFRLNLSVSGKAATVKVRGSGIWTGNHSRNEIGADTIVFDTGAALETLTIGVGGELLWEIDYRDPVESKDRVIAFAGMCSPWRPQ